jgi:hypothetical protein
MIFLQCAMLPRASELNLLSKSESFASSKTLNRFFFTTSFSNSACSSPPSPSLKTAFKIVLRVSFDDRLFDTVLSFSPVAPQKATAPCRTTGSTSFSSPSIEKNEAGCFSFCTRVVYEPRVVYELDSVLPVFLYFFKHLSTCLSEYRNLLFACLSCLLAKVGFFDALI